MVWHGYDCRGGRGEGRHPEQANVGDSRVYLVPKPGRPQQISRDHTWVREALDAGRITPEAAKNHPSRGALTRSWATSPPWNRGQPTIRLTWRYGCSVQ